MEKKSKMNNIRTDLAVEICSDLWANDSEPSGIECKKDRRGSLDLETVTIKSPEGASLAGKPMGTYITVSCGKLWLEHREKIREKLFEFRDLIRPLIAPKSCKSILVAGLGNEGITADAIGPLAVKNLIVTRHIRAERPQIFEHLGLFDLCAVTPGVLGQTGIESADVIRSVVERVHPDLLIVIDSLASRDLSRLVNTIQISDSGISPGSGIGNSRPALSPEELGIPMISIGVPTVVDAATLAADAIRSFSDRETDGDAIRKEWSKNGLNFFVTPKETDQIIRVLASFIGHGINLALNRQLSYEDMLSLAGG